MLLNPSGGEPAEVLRSDASIIPVVPLRVIRCGDDRPVAVKINDLIGGFLCSDTGAVSGTCYDIVLGTVDLKLRAVIALCQQAS